MVDRTGPPTGYEEAALIAEDDAIENKVKELGFTVLPFANPLQYGQLFWPRDYYSSISGETFLMIWGISMKKIILKLVSFSGLIRTDLQLFQKRCLKKIKSI